MPANCVCQWARCLAYSNAFTEANHPVAGFYNISYGSRNGTRNMPVRKMVEKHLSVADGLVKRNAVYKVACHHWPELLVIKNKNENRSINVLMWGLPVLRILLVRVQVLVLVRDHMRKQNSSPVSRSKYFSSIFCTDISSPLYLCFDECIHWTGRSGKSFFDVLGLRRICRTRVCFRP